MKKKFPKDNSKLIEKVRQLRSEGLTIRPIAKIVRRSHGWVGGIIQEMQHSTTIATEPVAGEQSTTPIPQLSKLASEILRRQNLVKPPQPPSVTDTINTRIGAISVKDTIQNRLK